MEELQIGLDRYSVSMEEEKVQLKEGVLLDTINASDNAITTQSKKHKGVNRAIFSVTTPRLFNDTNEFNVTKEDLPYVISMVTDLLVSEGIYVDTEYEYLTKFEVNSNVNDSKLFDVMIMIKNSNIFINKKKVMTTDNEDGIQSMKVLGNKYNLKVYKKTEQLLETGYTPIQQDLIRFEIEVSDHTQKERLFGKNITPNGMVNNWHKVEEFYKTCIVETIKKPVAKYLKQLENECVDKLNSGMKPSQVVNELMFTNKLVDLTVFDNAMKRHYKATGKKKPQTVIKSTHNRLKKLNEQRYNQVVGNVEILERFYQMLGI